MATAEDWNHEQMLQLYLYDYMVKRKMHKTAEIFKKEVKIPDRHSFAINDSRQGFLYEWWSLFFSAYIQKHTESKEDKEEAFLLAMQMEEMKQQLRDNIVVPKFVTEQQSPEHYSSRANEFANNFNEIEDFTRQPSDVNFDPTMLPLDVDQPDFLYSVPSSPSHLLSLMLEQAQVQGNVISLGRASSGFDPVINGLINDIFPGTEFHDAGMNQGINHVPLNGWPVNVPNQQRFQELATEYQQPLSSQVQPCTPGYQTFGPGNSMLTLNEMGGYDQQANSEMMSFEFQKTTPLTITAYQQNQCEQPQWQQLLDNGGMKKGASRLRTRESPVERLKANGNGIGVEKLDSFVPLDNDNAESPNSPLTGPKCDSTGSAEKENKGFSFNEVGCHSTSNSELLCCHFSSDGKLLASGGVEQKLFIWNVETSSHFVSFERHRDPITDIRFQPGSNTVATSSLDHTVKIWDATRPKKAHYHLQGHAEQIMSIDFHPMSINLLCSCDFNGEIRYWDLVDSPTRIHTFKGAKKQVRFQPQFGKLLATASDNVVAVFDVETKTRQLSWKGHAKDVLSVCWDKSGKYLLSVSEDSAQLWSITSGGKSIRELRSNGKEFHSCTSHPGYEHTWIIGGFQFMELWDPERNGSMVIPSHKGLVAGLAQSDQTSMVASVSHDSSTKLWK